MSYQPVQRSLKRKIMKLVLNGSHSFGLNLCWTKPDWPRPNTHHESTGICPKSSSGWLSCPADKHAESLCVPVSCTLSLLSWQPFQSCLSFNPSSILLWPPSILVSFHHPHLLMLLVLLLLLLVKSVLVNKLHIWLSPLLSRGRFRPRDVKYKELNSVCMYSVQAGQTSQGHPTDLNGATSTALV